MPINADWHYKLVLQLTPKATLKCLRRACWEKPFFLWLGKSVVIQQCWTPNSWLFNHLLEPLSSLLLDLQFLSHNRWKLLRLEVIMPHLLSLFCCSYTDYGSEKCWRYFFPFVGPTISVLDLQKWALQSNSNTNSSYCWGALNCWAQQFSPNKSTKGVHNTDQHSWTLRLKKWLSILKKKEKRLSPTKETRFSKLLSMRAILALFYF